MTKYPISSGEKATGPAFVTAVFPADLAPVATDFAGDGFAPSATVIVAVNARDTAEPPSADGGRMEIALAPLVFSWGGGSPFPFRFTAHSNQQSAISNE
jgi:hypothetical protein